MKPMHSARNKQNHQEKWHLHNTTPQPLIGEIQMILDVGCGKPKRGTIGVDYSRNSDADIIADAHFLPFKDEVFDQVASFTVLEHSPNTLNFLKEQTRVLKPGGKIVCITDNAQFYR